MAEREFKEKSMAYIRICPVCHGIIEIDEGDYYKTTHKERNKYYDKQCYERKVASDILEQWHTLSRKDPYFSFDEKDARRFAKHRIEEELRRGWLEEYTNGKRVR